MSEHTGAAQKPEKEVLRRHLRPHATFGDDPSGWCGCAGCEPSEKCGCQSCREVHDPLACPPDGGCPGCGNWPEHCVCEQRTSPGSSTSGGES